MKIKASLTGALIDYFMQCSDFCHVYRGIVSLGTHFWLMDSNLMASSSVDMDHCGQIKITIIIVI